MSSTDFSIIILLISGCQLDFTSMASKSTGSASKYLKVPLLLPSIGDDSDDDDNDDDDNDDEEEEEEGDKDNNMVREEVKYVNGRKKEAEVVIEVEVGAPMQSEEADITVTKSYLKGEIK